LRAKCRLLIFGGGVAGLLLLAAAASFCPPVQTYAAQRFLASATRPGSSLRHLSAGLSRVSLTGLRLDLNGAILTVPSAEAELAVLSAGLGRGFHVRRLVAKGWTLDLASRGPAGLADVGAGGRGPATPWAARAAGSLLAAFNVPSNLSVDGVDLEGTVIFPDENGRPMGRAQVAAVGGGLATGRSGRFLCRVSAALDDAAAPVSALAVRGALSATIDPSGTFTRADIRMEANARGREFPAGIGLTGEASAARNAGSKVYMLALERGGERIASLDAQNADGSRRFAGAWHLGLKDTDLAPFALGRSLPKFDVAGEGAYDFDAATRDVHAVGKLRASADRLGILTARLAGLSPVDLAADFDFAAVGSSLRVDRLEASLSGAKPVASVRALQPFEFNASTGELKVARPTGDLVGISLTGVPLAWVAGSVPAVAIAGDDVQGEFVIRAEDGRLALRTKAPLQAAGVSLSPDGRPFAAGLEVSAFVLADYAPQGWQFQLAPLSVKSDGIRMLSLEARLGGLTGGGQALKAAGSWSADLPALLAQPGAADLPRLTAGDASGSFEASLDSTLEVLAKVALRNLAMDASPAVALPSVTSDIRADFEPNGRTAFSLPLHLDYGSRTADLALSGTYSSSKDGPAVDGTFSGTRLALQDLAAVSALTARPGPEASAAAAGPADGAAKVRAARPFWPAIHSRLSVRLESVELPRMELSDVRGTVVVAPTSLRVESGTASIGGGSAARIDGEIKFSPVDVQPYSFWASVAAENVDSAPLFRSIDPDKPPAIEGRFDLTGHLAGSAEDPANLLGGSTGECKLSSKDGLFRALRTDVVDAVKQAPSKLVDALDSVTSLFGKKTDKLGEALVESATGLSEIHYDQVSVTAVRGADLNIILRQFVLIAPEERISGSGSITYQEGVPIRAQPLSVDLEVGARGRLGMILGIVGMLKEGGADELGYTPLYQTVHLGGTLQNIDQGQWREMLVQAPLRKGSRLFDKLLGR
jgi:hypothetical protein